MTCPMRSLMLYYCFFFQAEDGIRDLTVTGVQTCALPILWLDPQALRCAPSDHRLHQQPVRATHIEERPAPVDAVGDQPASLLPRKRAPRERSEERRVGEEGRSRGAPYH